MSTQEQITRLQTARNTLRNKAVALGIATNTDKLDTLATAYDNITNNGSVNADVKEGESYTIPKGYHDGSGTVKGVAGGGNYTLQTKSVTPEKRQISVASDEGYYGLSSVTVAPIPDAYQDVTGVTAGAGDVLANKVIVDAEGNTVAGTMPNNGAVQANVNVSNPVYTVPEGYHNGSGTVSVQYESLAATPTESEQVIESGTGKFIDKVTVAPIPEAYADTTDATAKAENILLGETSYAYTEDGEGNKIATKITGTMPNNEAVQGTVNTTNPEYTVPEGYHNGSGKVTVQSESLEATPTKSEQVIKSATNKFLDKVTVAPIPDAFQDVTGVTTTADKVLTGSKYVAADGTLTNGTMPNNGSHTASMDGLTTTSVTIPEGYHDGTGSISLANDIELALAAI